MKELENLVRKSEFKINEIYNWAYYDQDDLSKNETISEMYQASKKILKVLKKH